MAVSNGLGGVGVAVPAAYSLPYASSYSASVVNHAVAAPVVAAAAPLVAAPAPIIAARAVPPYFAAPAAPIIAVR
ncbi:hypothetical protein ABEB36_001781 [Hypothenemus hampei]|uniref:Uncharacterized protein n=1 Tax=Hypothenemus hampei TaxID=57062 RepID=A0ABD1FFQ5_HYPHA